MSSRFYFIAGAAGFLVLLATMVLRVVLRVVPPYSSFLVFIAFIGLSAGMILGAFTFLGFRAYYGFTIGLVTFILTEVFWGGLVCFTLTVEFLIFPSGILVILLVLGIGLMGVILVLWGMTLIAARDYTDTPRIPLTAGALFITAGVCWCFFFTSLGDLVLLPALILGMASLVKLLSKS